MHYAKPERVETCSRSIYGTNHAVLAAGVIVGLLAMGESLPSSASMKALRLLSWIVTILGVSALANGKGILTSKLDAAWHV